MELLVGNDIDFVGPELAIRLSIALKTGPKQPLRYSLGASHCENSLPFDKVSESLELSIGLRCKISAGSDSISAIFLCSTYVT